MKLTLARSTIIAIVAKVLGYDPQRDRWSVVGHTPGTAQVTTPAIEWRGETVIASGEIRPGIRTAKVWAFDGRQL
jgi:N-acetylneuraminate epimerase